MSLTVWMQIIPGYGSLHQWYTKEGANCRRPQFGEGERSSEVLIVHVCWNFFMVIIPIRGILSLDSCTSTNAWWTYSYGNCLLGNVYNYIIIREITNSLSAFVNWPLRSAIYVAYDEVSQNILLKKTALCRISWLQFRPYIAARKIFHLVGCCFTIP